MNLNRIRIFLKSLFWHVSRGLPKSGKKIILERYNICIVCDKYDTINTQCTECGCNISNKNIFLNKLAWADQECPIGKWNSLVKSNG